MTDFFRKIKSKVKELKRETVVISYAMLDKRTPVLAKIFAAVTVAYLLSPIDLIPDFIPVLGLLDDLILIPILIRSTLSLIPATLLAEIRARVNSSEKLQKRWYFALPVIITYIVLIVLIYTKFF